MLPNWVTVVVVLALLGLFGWNVATAGPEGYPTSLLIGGLLAGYGGINNLLGKIKGGDGK